MQAMQNVYPSNAYTLICKLSVITDEAQAYVLLKLLHLIIRHFGQG